MTSRESIAILTDPPPPEADVRLAYGPDPLQFGDLRFPDGSGPHPLVVVIHGGYWQASTNLTHAGHLCVDLARHGVATWNVEYRRIGDPGGGFPGPFQDVEKAVGFVRKIAETFPLDLDHVAVFGHSAGGHLALWAGARTDLHLRGVVLAAGVVDLHETHRRGDDRGLIARLPGGSPEDLPERWRQSSPRTLLPLGVRQTLICGSEDVHYAPNEAYAAAARQAGDEVQWLALHGAGHFELIDPQAEEWNEVLRALVRMIS